MNTEKQMVAVFRAMRDVILNDLDAALAGLEPDLSAIAREHAVAYAAGFRRGLNTAREAIEAMQREDEP